MDYLLAFVVGGSICVAGQILMDFTKLTTAHVMVLVVVGGAVLSGLGLYEPLVEFAGAGASVPLSNFGHVLTKGVLDHLEREGLFGLLSGVFEVAGGVIAAAILFGFLAASVFRPKG